MGVARWPGMLIRRHFFAALSLLALAAALAGCSGHDSSDSDPVEEGALRTSQRIERRAVKVAGAIESGTDQDIDITSKLTAVTFNGNKDDVVKIAAHLSTRSKTAKAKLFLLKDVGDSYVTVRDASLTARRGANAEAKLTTSGKFVIAVQIDGSSPATAKVNVKLSGVPANRDDSFVAAAKASYEESNDNNDSAPGEGVDVDALPAAAKRLYKEWDHDWGPDYAPQATVIEIQGKKVYVISDSNDGGMMVSLFDASGEEIASGGAGESSPFEWSN
jgi:hypothetical protein